MTLPQIHANGTSPARLRDGYEKAREAIDAAYAVLRKTAPNARDHSDGHTFDAATKGHLDRLRRLDTVIVELDELVGHCARAAEARS